MKRPPPSRFQITGSVFALPGIREALGRAIYETDLAKAQVTTQRGIAAWDDLSAEYAAYVLKQADAAAEVVDEYRGQCRGKRPPRDPDPIQGNKILVEDLARATHSAHGRNLPTWKSASEDLRHWYRQRAMSVARVIDDAIARHGKA